MQACTEDGVIIALAWVSYVAQVWLITQATKQSCKALVHITTLLIMLMLCRGVKGQLSWYLQSMNLTIFVLLFATISLSGCCLCQHQDTHRISGKFYTEQPDGHSLRVTGTEQQEDFKGIRCRMYCKECTMYTVATQLDSDNASGRWLQTHLVLSSTSWNPQN